MPSNDGPTATPDEAVENPPEGLSRVYDRPSRRAHDGLSNSAAELFRWVAAKLLWGLQILAVTAAMASFAFGFLALRSRAELADADETIEVVATWNDMIRALNRANDQLDSVLARQAISAFAAAMPAVDSARVILREDPSFLHCQETGFETEQARQLVRVLCEMRGFREAQESLLRREVAAGRAMDLRTIEAYNQQSTSYNAARVSVEGLVATILGESR